MLTEPFQVRLLPIAGSEPAAQALPQALAALRSEYPLCDTQESLQLLLQPEISADQVVNRVQELLAGSRNTMLVVIGDPLVEVEHLGSYRPSQLAKDLRTLTLDPGNVEAGHLCGLVGLVSGSVSRTQDLDAVVDLAQLPSNRLERAVCRTASGLWLKSRHAPVSLASADPDHPTAVRIQLVDSRQQWLDCLALRHRVYHWMGYLDDELAHAPSQLDVDPFDKSALHFAATDIRSGDVVGTLRLVVSSVSRTLRQTTIGNPYRAWKRQHEWCRRLAAEASDTVIRERLQSSVRLPLPILQNSDFGEHWPEFLSHNRISVGGEISRVVVTPRYQGLGVSSLLLRAAIATACDLQKHFLLLECIPAHAAMYGKSGFQALTGHHCRAQGLDQVAIGMRLDLTDSPYNAPVQLAKRDVQTMQRYLAAVATPDQPGAHAEALCLCDLRPCWKDGHYLLRGQENCPLARLAQTAGDGSAVGRSGHPVIR